MWKLLFFTPPYEIRSKNRYLTDSAYRSGTMSENAGRNLSDDFFRKSLLTFSGFCISAEFRKKIFKNVYRREVPNRFLMSSESCIQNLSDQLFFRIFISAKFVFPRKCISAEMGCGIKKKCTGEMFEIDFLYHQNLIHKICQMTFLFFLISAKFIFPRK